MLLVNTFFLNPNLFEINDYIEKTLKEHECKYAYRDDGNVIKSDVKFLDNIKKKTKNITVKNIKICIIASHNGYELNKIIRLTIIIEGTIGRNVINTFMKGDKIPFLWRKFFLNIANNIDYVYSFCNRPFIDFHRHCREWYF